MVISYFKGSYCKVHLKWPLMKDPLYMLVKQKLWHPRPRKGRKKPPHDKTNRMACAPSKDSDQPGHLPSLIRVFTVRMKKAWVLSYPLSAQRRLWSDWADAQADLSLRWAHMPFCWFCHEVAHMLVKQKLWHQARERKKKFTEVRFYHH